MKKKVTIRDVARQAGVSVTTVSQILNGKGQRFSKRTREHVLELRDKLNYVPDFNARNLILHSSQTIGVLVPSMSNSFFSSFIQGVQDKCRTREIMPLVFGANHDEKLERYYLTQLVARSVDGLIIASSTITTKTIDEILRPAHLPYVLFDQNGSRGGDRLEVDDYQGGRLAALHLASLGHRHVVMVMPNDATTNVHQRLAGFVSVLEEHHISFVPDRDVVSAKLTKRGGYEATRAVLERQPTAVFAANDEIAIGLMRGFKEQGVKVPDDISVMGYDGIDFDEYVTPALTTVQQPTHQIGAAAVQMLFKRIDNSAIELQRVFLPVQLISRQSTAKLK
ncbi:MAG: LacI family transcriptional regulator [[Lactobacillus] timonensis]|jgi:LacI family transcriptional regulator|uniref:ribose utilization transcriptional repressor RbsR n=1 Tax=[Lactobacillus] timonensis TaxID=1970790 RepID=UPI002352C427|nr:LacI family DNA-binding transcriptional regulator [[Lactobacillus] timonensis]MCI1926408.1 LacI family transcriptional regulator [[Lactobacillus] timonensis]MCI1957753.1 LacI family transcriptional regulator [[Lactobacillus] timonensis]MCI1970787.1 LacI family transcriptional regulator [[Lactobacillus] timonensis]MCI2006933.1 LacI family transcriptional regulator [[Lactobacillus] timonensis]